MTEKDFINVGTKYRGTDLWMLNDKLDGAELERQIEEMKEKGCGSFITRTFRGLKSDYPGEDFMEKMQIIINKAKETGLKIFLQAGYMPGGIPNLPEEYTHKVIKVAAANSKIPSSSKIISKSNDTIYYTESVSHFLDLLNPNAMKYYMKISYTDVWERFAGEFGKTIVSVWVDEPHFTPPFLPWSETLPGQFEKMWGYDLTEKINLLFDNTGEYRSVRYHYWRTILHLFKESYFEEVKKWCSEHNLNFSGHLMGEDTFERQIGFSGSVMPLYKYMDIPGIDFLTNSMEWPRGAAPGGEVKFLMTPLQCVSAARQAGKEDILCEMYGVSAQGISFSRQKYIFDYFISLGINYRCVHAMFYSMKGERKRFYAPHMSYQQPWWKYYREVTDYCARVSWFMHNGKPMSDILVLHPIESAFMEYNSSISSYSEAVIIENTYKSKLARMNQAFANLLRSMLGTQLVFDLGDEDTLSECGRVLDSGAFEVGNMRYNTIVIPDLSVIRESTLRLLKEFADKGGKIAVKGSIPEFIEGKPDNRFSEIKGIMYVDDDDKLIKLLQKESVTDYSFSSDDDSTSIWINMRMTEKGRIAFIFNADDKRSRNGVLNIRGMYEVQRWNPENGTVNKLDIRSNNGTTSVDISLEPGGSIMLVLEQSSNAEMSNSNPVTESSCSVEMPEVIQSVRLSDKWDIRRNDPNALVLEFCRFKKAGGEYSSLYPVLAVQQILTEENYKGPVTLRFEFEVSHIPGNIKLVAEEIEEYGFLINNKPVKGEKTNEYFIDKSFKILDITGTIKQGLNVIEATRYFEPMQKAASILISLFQSLSGVELESMYLIGDFGVFGTTEPTDTGLNRFGKYFSIGKELSEVGNDITVKGYPFYAGTVVLSKTLNLVAIPENKKAVLAIEGFNACTGTVSINGSHAGNLRWKPYMVDITGKLRTGGNLIEITLANTLRNLLGPYHIPKGDMPECWSNAWTGDFDRNAGKKYPDWYVNREPENERWTDSYMLHRFGIERARIDFI